MSEDQKPEKKPVEQWLSELKPELWKHNAAKAGRQWPIGLELTRDEYLAALEAAAHVALA